MKSVLRIYVVISIILFLPLLIHCQASPDGARIIFNGGYIVITNNANVVLQNSDPLALTVLNSGGIMSDGSNSSNVIWSIGNNARYTLPFISSDYTAIPVSFTPANASGAGSMILNTYSGAPDWNNEDYKPSGIGNIYRNGVNNSTHVIDRFWKLDAEGFTRKPDLTNLVFTYTDAEWNESGNAISEVDMSAQRWNNVSNTWSDFYPSGSDNTSSNTVTVASVTAADLFMWWTLVDAAFALPIDLMSFTATADRNYVTLDWKTASELNTNHFTIEKTADRQQIISAGIVPAAGNSTSIQHYSFTDKTPFKGVSFYRLKSSDNDGKFSYSQWQKVSIGPDDQWQVYPNPATDKVYIQGNSGNTNTVKAALLSMSGVVIKQLQIKDATTVINLAGVAAGTYFLQLNAGGIISSFKIIKN